MLKPKLAYGLIDKDGKTTSIDTIKDLGPDRSLYKEYEKRKEDEAYYKKKKHGEDSNKKLSESEKKKLWNEMELIALHFDREKLKKI
jgi:hypothetical protein